MREISAQKITEVVKKLCIEANCFLPQDLKQRIEKSEMMLLDLLSNFDWNRPICFTQVYILQDY